MSGKHSRAAAESRRSTQWDKRLPSTDGRLSVPDHLLKQLQQCSTYMERRDFALAHGFDLASLGYEQRSHKPSTLSRPMIEAFMDADVDSGDIGDLTVINTVEGDGDITVAFSPENQALIGRILANDKQLSNTERNRTE